MNDGNSSVLSLTYFTHHIWLLMLDSFVGHILDVLVALCLFSVSDTFWNSLYELDLAVAKKPS